MKVTSQERALRSKAQVETPTALEDADISFYRDGVPIRVSETHKSRSVQELQSSVETSKYICEFQTGHGHRDEERVSSHGEKRAKAISKIIQSCKVEELRSSLKAWEHGSGLKPRHEEQGNSASLLDVTTSINRPLKSCSLKEPLSFFKDENCKCNQVKPVSRKLQIRRSFQSKGRNSHFKGSKIFKAGSKNLSMKIVNVQNVEKSAHPVPTPKSSTTSGNETWMKANDVHVIGDYASRTSKATDEFLRSGKLAVSGCRVDITSGKRRRTLTEILLGLFKAGSKDLTMKVVDVQKDNKSAHTVPTPESSTTSGNETWLKANDVHMIGDYSSRISKATDEVLSSRKRAISGCRVDITSGKRRRTLTEILLEAPPAGEANPGHDSKPRKKRCRKLLASPTEAAPLGPLEPADGQLHSAPTEGCRTTFGDSPLRQSSAAGLNSRLQADAQHQAQDHEGVQEGARIDGRADEGLQRMDPGRLEHTDDRIFTKTSAPDECMSGLRCHYDFGALDDHENCKFSFELKHEEVAKFLHAVAMSSEGFEIGEDLPVPPSSTSCFISRQPGDQETPMEIDGSDESRKCMKYVEAKSPAEAGLEDSKTVINFSISSNNVLPGPPDQIEDKERAEWKYIRRNVFRCRQRRKKNGEIMICQCRPSKGDQAGCGDGCLNRLLNIECNQELCPCGASCSNQRFQKQKYVAMEIIECGKKGYGLRIMENARKDTFLIEYVGEVLDKRVRAAREQDYIRQGREHLYFMSLSRTQTIDASLKGNFGRFINHSCEPNCKTEKWMVDGEICIGVFAITDLEKGEEITIDYNYVFARGLCVQKCECGHGKCRGYIGLKGRGP